MSYPAPPGLKTSQSQSNAASQSHPSLPARPPPPAGGASSFKPAFSAGPTSTSAAPGVGNYGGFTGFKPRSVVGNKQDWRTANPTVSAGPQPPSAFTASQSNYNSGYQQAPYQYEQPQYYQNASGESHQQPSAPQIRNPFPLPGQDGYSAFGNAGGNTAGYGNSAYEPEMEAQIAQWQSAYLSKDENAKAGIGNASGGTGNANTIPLGTRGPPSAPLSSHEMAAAGKTESGVAAVVAGADGKQKTVIRSGGGQTWQDSSLLEWDPAHFRLFVGNLAGEVTDESLLKAFSKYDSVQKARVVRDKRTTKSKGYGFVSFSNGDQYFQAAKDMQGKYIGSHPVLLRRSTTEIKAVKPHEKRQYGKGGKKGDGSAQGANTGAGVSKKQSKTKGGLKILG